MQICYKCEKTLQLNDCHHGLHQDCFQSWFGLHHAVDFTDVSLKRHNNESATSITHLHTSFFHGKFKKYSAQLAGKSYILKVQQHEYTELPYIEYMSNIIAQKLELPVPPFYLIRFLNEMDTFVVRNFMDSHTPGNLIHCYHFLKEKDEFSVKNILNIISEQVGHLNAIHQFIHMCLFDSLIGNHDRHGRNIAFIETRKGMILAPFYDNPSYIGIEDHALLLAQHNPKGRIATQSSIEPTLEDYVLEFSALGYSSIVQSFMARVQKIDFQNTIRKPYLSTKRQDAFLALIERRKEELENAILI